MKIRYTTHSEQSFEDLLDAGSRHNPKRPFVFVSKVLGKHWPCRPSVMRDVQHELATRLSPDPAVFIGMAETATGLAEGVFSEWCHLNGAGSVYIATTRYPLDGQPSIDFSESHSHATALKLYWPSDPVAQIRLLRATRIVLIDDEVSTGKTFEALITALLVEAPQICSIDVVALTDFSGTAARDRLLAIPAVEFVRVHSLVSGEFEFDTDVAQTLTAPVAQRAVSCRRHRMQPVTPRIGRTEPPIIRQDIITKAVELAEGRAVRVIATGECMYPAQQLGQALETLGLDCLVQSTTRSPLLVDGAIRTALEVVDPYGEGVPNYIYNLPMERSDSEVRILIHETGENPEIRLLARQLDAAAFDITSGLIIQPIQELTS